MLIADVIKVLVVLRFCVICLRLLMHVISFVEQRIVGAEKVTSRGLNDSL